MFRKLADGGGWWHGVGGRPERGRVRGPRPGLGPQRTADHSID